MQYFRRGSRGRVELTQAGRTASPSIVLKALKEAGIEVCRSTLFRARQNDGVIQTQYFTHSDVPRRKLWYVRLTEAERGNTATALARRFGITPGTAQRAIERGWFEVHATTNATALTQERQRHGYIAEEA